MSDNFTFTPGTGASGAADDIGGILYQRVKVTWGLDGTATDTSTTNPLPTRDSWSYETVAAGQTDQILGATGAVGDYLHSLLIVPATTSPGAVSIKDGNGSAITVFTGGTGSVGSLVPFNVFIGAVTTAVTTPGWKVTTGVNVSVFGQGVFT